MGWKREGDRIIIDLTQEQWEILVYALGYATGNAHHGLQKVLWQLANEINDGNPNWVPYKEERNETQ